MKGSTKIKITLIISAIFLAVITLPKYVMMLPWDNDIFINRVIATLILNEILSTLAAIIQSELSYHWEKDWWYKWFSISAWIVVGVRLLWKHSMELADKYLTD